MTSARALGSLLLLCTLTVFAQDQPKASGKPEPTTSAPSVEAWKIIPDDTAKANLEQDALVRLQTSRPPRHQNHSDQSSPASTNSEHSVLSDLNSPRAKTSVVDSLGRITDDATCLTIRSYVVARDSKDSDSTHLVRYSTCQPASRYQLRTAVGSDGR